MDQVLPDGTLEIYNIVSVAFLPKVLSESKHEEIIRQIQMQDFFYKTCGLD